MLTLAAAGTLQAKAGTATAVSVTVAGMELTGSPGSYVETYKVLGQAQLGTSAAALYTVPGSTTGFVKEIHVANTTAAVVSGITFYVNGAAAANTILPSLTLPPNGFAVFAGSGWTVYDATGRALTGTSSPTSGAFTILNVKDFGATGDGSTNDTSAIQACLTAAQVAGVSGRGVSVYFPDGIYVTSAALTVTGNNVTLRGAGRSSTIIYPTHASGDVLQFGNGSVASNGLAFMDMTIFAPSVRTAGAGINVNLAHDTFIDNFSMNNMVVGVLVQGGSIKVNIQNGTINATLAATGVGVQVTNGLAGDTYIGPNLVMSNAVGSKPLAGIAITQTGHCSIYRANITSCLTALLVNPGASQDVSYIFCDHSLFDSSGTGASFSPTNATGRIRSAMFLNSWFSGSTVDNGIKFNGVASSAVDALSFIGCRILNNFQHGVIYTYASTANTSFTDCTIAGNGQQTINTYDGINVAANTNSISVVNCKIGVAGTATNQQRYAINVAAGTSGGLQFVCNDCQPNGTLGTNGYINLGALTGYGNQIAFNNPDLVNGDGQATVAASAAINTTETIISQPFRIPASAMDAGTTIRFTVVGTNTSTVAGVTTFRVRLGTAGTTADTAIMTFALAASAASGTTVPFVATIAITCRTTGAAATFYGSLQLVNNGTTGISTTATQVVLGTAAAGNTTTANVINVTAATAATTTTNTFQQVVTEVVRP